VERGKLKWHADGSEWRGTGRRGEARKTWCGEDAAREVEVPREDVSREDAPREDEVRCGKTRRVTGRRGAPWGRQGASREDEARCREDEVAH
jgi:hypothetical protein